MRTSAKLLLASVAVIIILLVALQDTLELPKHAYKLKSINSEYWSSILSIATNEENAKKTTVSITTQLKTTQLDSSKVTQQTSSQNTTKSRLPLILGWTKFHRIPLSKAVRNFMSNCEYECEVTDDRSRLAEAYIVVYHGANMNPKDLAPTNITGQLRAFFMLESPGRSEAGFYRGWDQIPMSHFNITMTYLRKSDYWDPYNSLEPLTNRDQESFYTEEEVDEAISQKTNSSYTLVSHCGASSKRDHLIKLLSNYTSIDQYGSCTGATKCDKNCGETLKKSYHFFFALENTICEEYITEKFFRMKKLVVPITFKRRFLEHLVPPDSFIAVDDFCSLEELGKYLNYLIANEEAYRKYFDWSRRYRKVEHKSRLCKLCRDLHHKKVATTDYSRCYSNIRSFMPKSSCNNGFGMELANRKCEK